MASTDNDMELAPYTSAPAQSLIVRPVGNLHDMQQARRDFENAKTGLLLPSDIQIIQGRPHIKKSGWLTIARYFGISVEPMREQYIVDGDTFGYEVVARAVAPNGASMTGDGTCWSTEKKGNQCTRHNVRAHAFTRAVNRAISNLVGGGEVSAEELNDYIEADPTPAAARHNPRDVRPINNKPQVDPWAEVRELATRLGLSDDERKAIFAKHKKNPASIAADLRARCEEPPMTVTVHEAAEPEPAYDLHDLGTVQP